MIRRKDQFCLTTETMDKTLSLKTSEAYAHGSAPMASGLKKQDGKKIACVVLVATKKGRERNKITLVKPCHHKGVHLGRKDGKKTAESQDQ